MCGIVAVWGESAPNLAETIAQSLTHRGPDGHGVVHMSKPGLALAHRRLAIIDPEGGQQPLLARGDTAALVANGMIYNDGALRASLDDSDFISASDSESILQSCLDGGTSAVARLDGMYAFVMAHGEKLTVARDPLGIKPLYVGRRGDTFCFASEIKALLPVVDEIQEFPPGHVFDSEHGLQRHYSLPLATDDISDADVAQRAIRKTLTQAIEKRLRSDVPIGVFLSGGLDSSIIAAIASQSKVGLKSFAVGLPGSPDLVAARQVAAHLGTDHYEYEISAAEVMRDLPHILYHLESFDRDLVRSAVPCYYAARLAAEHVKVILTGEGADELFAGYTYHKTYENLDALQAELRRSVLAMHNINLQRVDRMTMANGLEARVPFLDRDFLDLAFRIPASLKLPRDGGIEKWVLRKAFEDLLPQEITWRDKSQFDQGSGIAELLEEIIATKTAVATYDHLPRPAHNAEENFYRSTLIEQFDKPAKLLPLVTHWDDDARIDDRPITRSSDAIGGDSSQPQRSRSNCGVDMNDFSALYDLPTARPYFQGMAKIDYRIPEAASGIFAWCIDELRSQHGAKEMKVLDLCAGYGVNGALMKTDMSMDELYRYFADQSAGSRDNELFDHALMMARVKDPDIHVIGLDVAANALDYASSARFMDECYAVDLETEALPKKLAESISECDLISITGGFSFISETTFEKILSAHQRATSSLPWIVGFPLLHTHLEPLFDLLRDYGYVIEADTQHRFVQRQFANKREQATEHATLVAAGLEVGEEAYFESRLLVARPPGMPSMPGSILKRAADYDCSLQPAAVFT
ncbi:MAG: asparagine synthase (glutamine-hydrolyzing) [Gammaproteobacteria bacterium]|jgi:asparagine synthase (glutamine-hydrolysing)